MSLAEFRSWVRFYEDEPFGDFRADLRAGIVASTVHRMMGAKGTRSRPIDFMPVVQRSIDRARASSRDPTLELRAALLQGFRGRLHHVVIKRGALNHGA